MRAANMKLNGEWGKHVGPFIKKIGNKKRRSAAKRDIKERRTD